MSVAGEGEVPDLMDDGGEAEPPRAMSPAAQEAVARAGGPPQREGSSSGSEQFGGYMHIAPPAPLMPVVDPHHAALWAAAEAHRQANGGGGAAGAPHAPVAAQAQAGGGGGAPPSVNGDHAANADLMSDAGDSLYNGFDRSILNAGGVPSPPNLAIGKPWIQLNDDRVTNMRPARAMRFLVPATLFARDARHFMQWVMPTDQAAARAYASAALCSMAFAGTAKGIPCGNHAERARAEQANDQQANGQPAQGQGRKEKQKTFDKANKYMFIPPHDPNSNWPMWQMGYEEIYNAAGTDVTFVGIWLWVYDPTHSTSELMAQVMDENSGLDDENRAGASSASMRVKSLSTEAEKLRRSGMGNEHLDSAFERTVGLQHRRIKDFETWRAILEQHAGPCEADPVGKLFVDDLDAHFGHTSATRDIAGDPTGSGLGSLHPAAIEFCCNAKRAQSLSFGAVNLDGTPGDIHSKYLDPRSYWRYAQSTDPSGAPYEYNTGEFCLPQGDSHMWICTSVTRRTIFSMPLPRPLTSTVLPGPHLMRLFLEREIERQDAAATIAAGAAAPAEAQDEPDPMDAPVGGDGGAALAQAQAMHHQAHDQPDAEEEALAAGELFGEEGAEGGEGDAQQGGGGGGEPMQVEEQEPAQQQEAPEDPRLLVNTAAYTRFRSLITKRDEVQRKADEAIRDTLRSYDNMSGHSGLASHLSSSDSIFAASEEGGGFKVFTEKICDRIARESSRAWSDIIKPWYSKKSREYEDRKQDLLDAEVEDKDDERWIAIEKEETAFEERFFQIKKDLIIYHFRCLQASFRSPRERHTLPPGYSAMFSALEELLADNGGTASMAFGAKGCQITASDRQVWQELQEWLGQIFGPDSRIEGRDRFLMDELFLQSFDMYADTTFIMIICSERGKGKSVRAMRMEKILPPGIVTWSSAASARAGMNGNNASSNGRLIIYDEMTSDLTAAEVGERMEYWKRACLL